MCGVIIVTKTKQYFVLIVQRNFILYKQTRQYHFLWLCSPGAWMWSRCSWCIIVVIGIPCSCTKQPVVVTDFFIPGNLSKRYLLFPHVQSISIHAILVMMIERKSKIDFFF